MPCLLKLPEYRNAIRAGIEMLLPGIEVSTELADEVYDFAFLIVENEIINEATHIMNMTKKVYKSYVEMERLKNLDLIHFQGTTKLRLLSCRRPIRINFVDPSQLLSLELSVNDVNHIDYSSLINLQTIVLHCATQNTALPPSLKNVMFTSSSFSPKFSNLINVRIMSLKFCSMQNFSEIQLPPNLETLDIETSTINFDLPSKLRILKMYEVDMNTWMRQKLKIPSSLKELYYFGCKKTIWWDLTQCELRHFEFVGTFPAAQLQILSMVRADKVVIHTNLTNYSLFDLARQIDKNIYGKKPFYKFWNLLQILKNLFFFFKIRIFQLHA